VASKNRRILETAPGQPAVESPKRVPDRPTGRPSLFLGATISDNGLLCQPGPDLSDRPRHLEDTSAVRLDQMAPCPSLKQDPLYPNTQLIDALIESYNRLKTVVEKYATQFYTNGYLLRQYSAFLGTLNGLVAKGTVIMKF